MFGCGLTAAYETDHEIHKTHEIFPTIGRTEPQINANGREWMQIFQGLEPLGVTFGVSPIISSFFSPRTFRRPTDEIIGLTPPPPPPRRNAEPRRSAEFQLAMILLFMILPHSHSIDYARLHRVVFWPFQINSRVPVNASGNFTRTMEPSCSKSMATPSASTCRGAFSEKAQNSLPPFSATRCTPLRESQ